MHFPRKQLTSTGFRFVCFLQAKKRLVILYALFSSGTLAPRTPLSAFPADPGPDPSPSPSRVTPVDSTPGCTGVQLCVGGSVGRVGRGSSRAGRHGKGGQAGPGTEGRVQFGVGGLGGTLPSVTWWVELGVGGLGASS